MVSFDNQCRLCVDGEEAAGNECKRCEDGREYSMFPSIACTSDCSQFTGHDSTCIKSKICNVNTFGNCVSLDDKTMLVMGLSIGIPLFLIIVIVTLTAILDRTGFFAARQAERAERLAEELELADFEEDIAAADVTPHRLTFGGRCAGKGEAVRDKLVVQNRSKETVLFGINCDSPQVAVSMRSGTVKGGEGAEIEVSVAKQDRGDFTGTVRVSIANKNKKKRQEGKHIEVQLHVKGMKEYELMMSEISVGEKIGEGACGVVYRGKYEGRDVAVKQIKQITAGVLEVFQREVEMLKTVGGQNVVAFYGASADNSTSALFHVTELMDLGTLTDVMSKHRLTAELKIKVMRDIAQGMQTVHSFNVIHRDLKPENVLCKRPLSTENSELCKITDFGTSRVAENVFAMTMTKGQGTPLYMAPEMLSGQKRYNKSVDVYSYGILCAVVWNDGQLPYSEYDFSNALEMQNAVIKGCRPRLKEGCPVVEMITQCWSLIVSERPPFDVIVSKFFS